MVDWLDANVFNISTNDHLQIALYYFILAIPASAMMMMITAVISSVIRKVALPRLETGTYAVHGGTYYRKWFASQILKRAYKPYMACLRPFMRQRGSVCSVQK